MRYRITPRTVSSFRLASVVLLAMLMLAGGSTSAFAANKNAKLVHVGPSGLESYNAWTKKSTTLVPGMMGSWGYPILSPNGVSAVTTGNTRSDRAYMTHIYGSLVSPSAKPFEMTVAPADADGWVGMTEFKGWLDDYRAVFVQYNDDTGPFVQDMRTPGVRSHYDGAVTYPSAGRKRTSSDRKYSVSVNKRQVMTISKRSNRKVVARFKVPGSGNGISPTGWYFGDSSISPDGKFIAYELWRSPRNDSVFVNRVYVSTLGGKSAKRLKNDTGGFVWR